MCYYAHTKNIYIGSSCTEVVIQPNLVSLKILYSSVKCTDAHSVPLTKNNV